jgi:hypothetical protein
MASPFLVGHCQECGKTISWTRQLCKKTAAAAAMASSQGHATVPAAATAAATAPAATAARGHSGRGRQAHWNEPRGRGFIRALPTETGRPGRAGTALLETEAQAVETPRERERESLWKRKRLPKRKRLANASREAEATAPRAGAGEPPGERQERERLAKWVEEQRVISEARTQRYGEIRDWAAQRVVQSMCSPIALGWKSWAEGQQEMNWIVDGVIDRVDCHLRSETGS